MAIRAVRGGSPLDDYPASGLTGTVAWPSKSVLESNYSGNLLVTIIYTIHKVNHLPVTAQEKALTN